jgi:hypothetical protein
LVLGLAGAGLFAATATASASSTTITPDYLCIIQYDGAYPSPGGGTCSNGSLIGEYDCTGMSPGNCWKYRTIVQFDVEDAIPANSQIDSVALNLPEGVTAHQLYKSWNDDLDWSTRDGTTPWSQPGGLADADVIDVDHPLAETVRGWVDGEDSNYGVLLTAQVPGNGDWIGFDEDPQLTIVYSADTTPPEDVDEGSDWTEDNSFFKGPEGEPVWMSAQDSGSGVSALSLEEVGGGTVVGELADCATKCPADFTVNGTVDVTAISEGRHQYRVRAVDGASNQAVSDPWFVSIDRTAPPAPTTLVAALRTGGHAPVFWNTPSDPNLADGTAGSGFDAFNYRYRRNGASWSAWTSGQLPSVTLDGASAGDTIDVEVSAKDTVGNVSSVASLTATVPAESTPTVGSEISIDDEDGGSTQRRVEPPTEQLVQCKTHPHDDVDTEFLDSYHGEMYIAFRTKAQTVCSPLGTEDALNAYRNAVFVTRVCLQYQDENGFWHYFQDDEPWSPKSCGPIKVANSVLNPGDDDPLTTLNTEVTEICLPGTRAYRSVNQIFMAGPLLAVPVPTTLEEFVALLEANALPFPGGDRHQCRSSGAWRRTANRERGGSPSKLLGDRMLVGTGNPYYQPLPPNGDLSEERQGWQAHHIVDASRKIEKRRGAVHPNAQDFAYTCGLEPNQPYNGIWLPGKDIANNPGVTRPKHSETFYTRYLNFVSDAIDGYVDTSGDVWKCKTATLSGTAAKNAMINRIFDADNGVWGKVRDGDFTWP